MRKGTVRRGGRRGASRLMSGWGRGVAGLSLFAELRAGSGMGDVLNLSPFGKGRTKEGFEAGGRLNYHPFPCGAIEKGAGGI